MGLPIVTRTKTTFLLKNSQATSRNDSKLRGLELNWSLQGPCLPAGHLGSASRPGHTPPPALSMAPDSSSSACHPRPRCDHTGHTASPSVSIQAPPLSRELPEGRAWSHSAQHPSAWHWAVPVGRWRIEPNLLAIPLLRLRTLCLACHSPRPRCSTALPSPIPMSKSCISVQSELESAPFVHVPNPSGETPFLLLLTADLPPFLTYEKGDFTWSGLMRFMFIVTSACGICT